MEGGVRREVPPVELLIQICSAVTDAGRSGWEEKPTPGPSFSCRQS